MVYFRKGIVLDTTLFFLNISFRAGAGKAVGPLNVIKKQIFQSIWVNKGKGNN